MQCFYATPPLSVPLAAAGVINDLEQLSTFQRGTAHYATPALGAARPVSQQQQLLIQQHQQHQQQLQLHFQQQLYASNQLLQQQLLQQQQQQQQQQPTKYTPDVVAIQVVTEFPAMLPSFLLEFVGFAATLTQFYLVFFPSCTGIEPGFTA